MISNKMMAKCTHFPLLLVLLACFTASDIAAAYTLPQQSTVKVDAAKMTTLQATSSAIEHLAATTLKGIVFVSVAKRYKGKQLGAIDPYEYFANPDNYTDKSTPAEPLARMGLGSGFFIDAGKGLILTNNHVIKDARDISVKVAGGEVYDAKVLGSDSATDLAVLQITSKNFKPKGLAHLLLGDSDAVRMGQLAFVLGAPYGLENSLSIGIISAIGRGNLKIARIGDFIQTDATINPGNSGGPLINLKGEVIGINTAIYSRSGASSGIGFAIPANLAAQIARQIIDKGEVARGFVGVHVQKLDEQLKNVLALPATTEGVLVQRVAKSSPAEQSGIVAGDVILKIDAQKMLSEKQLTEFVQSQPIGKELEVQLLRGKKSLSKMIKVAEWPAESYLQAAENTDNEGSLKFGATVRPLTDTLINELRAESKYGLLIDKIRSNSIAAEAGLQQGDIILKLNDEELRSIEQLRMLLKQTPRCVLFVERQRQFFFVPIE